MAATAYYVTATYTYAQDQTYGSAIVFANSPEEAQTLFANAFSQPREGESPKQITIRKTAVVPIVDRLLTESGDVPLGWAKIIEQSNSLVESTPTDDFEQGYWVDVDTVVPSDKMSFSAGTLESNVPEDVRSGLNWSGNKQFFFLLQVLPPPSSPPPPAYEREVEDADVENENESEPSDESGTGEIDVINVTWPETVAIIQARNSVAAAWLWRRYAANTSTQWNNNAIRITPLCATIGEVK